MIDIPALKARLSDPREVARLLGLRIESRGRNEVRVRCPVHGGKSASLRLRNNGDGLKMVCFGCGIYGDAIDLIGAMEGDPKRGLARAQELVGGGVAREYRAEPEPERMDSDAYHALATRILDAGCFDRREWTWPVRDYLGRRGLLELARGDGWACLPRLKWLIGLAKDVCDDLAKESRFADANRYKSTRQQCEDVCAPMAADAHPRDKPPRVRNPDCVTPAKLLIAAKLARWDRNGELVASWPSHRLVIPWRGPDGRICALQRRVIEKAEGPKYVLPWAPEWPYGSERVGYGTDSNISKSANMARDHESEHNDRRQRRSTSEVCRGNKAGQSVVVANDRRIAIVEGAVDTLALRALHPRFHVIGIPGINGWRASWASLVCHGTTNLEGTLSTNDRSRSNFENSDSVNLQLGNNLRIALDRGKPDPHGVVQEDRAAARIALDCAGRAQETERVLEWWLSRHRCGRVLGCALCGAGEAWLCVGCGRRRAPEGRDWGEVWEARSAC